MQISRICIGRKRTGEVVPTNVTIMTFLFFALSWSDTMCIARLDDRMEVLEQDSTSHTYRALVPGEYIMNSR